MSVDVDGAQSILRYEGLLADVTVRLTDKAGVTPENASLLAVAVESGVLAPLDSVDMTQYDYFFGGDLPKNYTADLASYFVDFSNYLPVATHTWGSVPGPTSLASASIGFVAVAAGEESFDDVNGNGLYDSTPTPEPFDDTVEPFLDYNDNGQRDAAITLTSGDVIPGEPFWDTNGDGVYTGANGEWDADALIHVRDALYMHDVSQTHIQYAPSRFYDLDNDGVYDPMDGEPVFLGTTVGCGVYTDAGRIKAFASAASDTASIGFYIADRFGLSLLDESMSGGFGNISVTSERFDKEDDLSVTGFKEAYSAQSVLNNGWSEVNVKLNDDPPVGVSQSGFVDIQVEYTVNTSVVAQRVRIPMATCQ